MKLYTFQRNLLILGVLFTSFLIPVDSATIARIGTEELVNKSELIFEGVVVSVQSEVNQYERVYTYIEFSVEDVLVGNDIDGETLTLRFTGGSAGGIELDVGVRMPQLDERGIYFVEQVSPGLLNPLLGWEQGHFVVNDNGDVVAANALTVEAVELKSNSNSTQISAGVAYGIVTSRRLARGIESVANAEIITIPMSLSLFKQRIVELRH